MRPGPTEDLLRRVPLFAGIGRVELARLAAHLEPVDFEPGADVVRQGEPGDSLYIVERGTFSVLLSAPDRPEIDIASLVPGDVFGEMALLTDEPRSATVRAESRGRVLRLARERFLAMLRGEPTVFLAVATTLSRRLSAGDRARFESDTYSSAVLERALEGLPPEHRRRVLDACVLDELSDAALDALFGADAAHVVADLATLDIRPDAHGRAGLRLLRQRLQRVEGRSGLETRVASVVERLVGAGDWHGALAVTARESNHAELAALLGKALRANPPLEPDQARRWLERLGDEDTRHDSELAGARAAMQAAALPPDRRPSEASAARVWRRAPLLAIASALAIGAALPGTERAWTFVALLGAAIVLMTSRVVPNFAAALALIAGWVVLGVARPADALAGFASKEWLFVFSVYGLAAATARSGVLFRAGLILVRRLPQRLLWQAATLLATGVTLTPLVPSSTARASLTSPLTLAVAEALGLPERGRSAAVLGLGAWIGSGPLMFAFLNGSGTCLLAWGLLPEVSRARFTWTFWVVAVAPLTLFLCAGALFLLLLAFRPDRVVQAPRARVDLQFAVLGPPSRREIAIITILILTVAGWIAAPRFGLDLAIIALLGLLAAVAVGAFDERAFQGLDWNFLLFFGVVLSIGKLAVTLGVDRVAATAVDGLFATWKPGTTVFVLAVALMSVVVRLVLEQDLTVLLMTLTLIPVAPALGADPWLVVIALLVTSVAWFLPSQTSSYLVAQAASEGRLFSHAQARRFAVAWTLLALIGLALSVPYWRLLGLAV